MREQHDLNHLVNALTGRAAELNDLPQAEWNSLLALAGKHSLTALLSARLRDAGLPADSHLQDELRRGYLISAAANVRTFHELGAVLRGLRAVAVPVIPLKGAGLAETVYGDIALRPMADIDLLVRAADLPRAIEALRSMGYSSRQVFDPVAQQAGFQDMPPMTRAGSTAIELHWTLVTPLCNARIGPGELAGIWSRSVPATIAGELAHVLSPEDLLLHLCMHASVHHRFAGVSLKPFVDIAEVTRHHAATMGWEQLAARANRWGVANGVRMALTLTEEWMGCVVPAQVWSRLDGEPPDAECLHWARHKVLEGGPAILNSELARLQSEEGIARRLAVLRDAAFPPRAVVARMYSVRDGGWDVFARYPYRLWDLGRRYGSAVWKLVRKDTRFVQEARQEARLREYLGWN